VDVLKRARIARLAVLSLDPREPPESWRPPVLTPAKRLTTLRALSPMGNVSVDARAAPRFNMTGVPSGALIQLQLQVRGEKRWCEIRRDLGATDIARDAERRVSARLPRENGPPTPSWGAVLEELEEKGQTSGGFVPIRWRALAVSARGAILAQSAWNQFRIRR
jgi:hypothetical protein